MNNQLYTNFVVSVENIGTIKKFAQSEDDAINKAFAMYKTQQPDRTKYIAKSILNFK